VPDTISSASGRTKQAKRKPNDWDRKKLRRIIKDRYGNHNLPTGNRDWVLALLLCGFKTKPILSDAPWLEPDELPVLRKTARKLSFEDIGRLIRLTFEDWLHYKAWRFSPCDRSPEEMKERKREKRRAGKRKRYREQHQQQPRKTDLRLDAILRMLNRPQTMAQLAKRARHSRAFSGLRRVMGSTVTARSLRVQREVVYRTVKQLAALGMVAITTRKGRRGPVLVVSKLTVKGRKNVVLGAQHKNVVLNPSGKRRQGNGLTPVSHPMKLSAFAYTKRESVFVRSSQTHRVSTSSVRKAAENARRRTKRASAEKDFRRRKQATSGADTREGCQGVTRCNP
jgi:hypothetical protein